jgi:hypothetical protein
MSLAHRAALLVLVLAPVLIAAAVVGARLTSPIGY